MFSFVTASYSTFPAWLKFAIAFASSPQLVGSLSPSSRSLQRRLEIHLAVRSAVSILELGPGLGETTRALLAGMSAGARLTAVELVPQFVRQLQAIEDPRLEVIEGSALDVERFLKRRQAAPPDLVVSGIPFSALSIDEGRELLGRIHNLLTPGGVFLTYQFRNRARRLADELFGPSRRTFLPWNLPPLWLDEWRKPAVPTGHRIVPAVMRRTAERG
ncbi:MAG: methyltransferase domain-containing protein [Planctomycetaceae bacterium]|nr:methyltransferase domain-containing protein [Planctomycetaceae bacterium]